jgi:hypothetical protein
VVTAEQPEILNFKDTECATTEEIKRLDNHLSNNGKRKYKAERKYYGSNHGFNAKAFHSKADNLRDTVSLYKLTNGTCIAGYTRKPWKSPSTYTYVKDSSAVLLNLTRSFSFTA